MDIHQARPPVGLLERARRGKFHHRRSWTPLLLRRVDGNPLGGAVGNLLSRMTTPRGVVDVIDLGVGPWRFYLFNVADIGICVGASFSP